MRRLYGLGGSVQHEAAVASHEDLPDKTAMDTVADKWRSSYWSFLEFPFCIFFELCPCLHEQKQLFKGQPEMFICRPYRSVATLYMWHSLESEEAVHACSTKQPGRT